MAGLLLLGLGMLVVQIIRCRVADLYSTTLAVRVGVLATSICYLLDRREASS